MAFHRFTQPSYLGFPTLAAAPAGVSFNGTTYDFINVTDGGTGAGGSAFANGYKASGPNVGTYLMAFGEDAISAHFNRGLRALAENTDFIDDILNEALAIPTRTAVVTAGAPVASIVLPAGTFVGDDVSDSLQELFSVVDQADRAIIASGTRVVVSSISGASVGDGFSTGSVTLNLNVSIPTSTQYRVFYGTQSKLAALPVDAFVFDRNHGLYADIIPYAGSGNWADGNPLSATTVEAALDEIVSDLGGTSGAGLIGVDASGFSGPLVPAYGGGLTTSANRVQAALDEIDVQLNARRTYTAVVTDGSISAGGDITSVTIGATLNSMGTGTYLLRRGSYEFATSPSAGTRLSLIGEPYNTTGAVTVTCTGGSDISFDCNGMNGACKFENIYFKSSNLTRFSFSDGVYDLRNCKADAGVMYFATGVSSQVRVQIDGLTISTNNATQTSFGETLSFGGASLRSVIGTVRNSKIYGVVTGAAPFVELNALSLSQLISGANTFSHEALTFENCYFGIASGVGVGGGKTVSISGCHQRIVFRGCVFHSEEAAYAVPALYMSNSSNVTFEDCAFIQDGIGTTLSVLDSHNVFFKRCRILTSPTTINEDEVVVTASNTGKPGVHFDECYIEVRAGDGTQVRRLEFGAVAGTPTNTGRIELNSLTVRANYADTNINDRFFNLRGGTTAGEVTAYARNLRFFLDGKTASNSSAIILNLNGFGGGFVDVEGLYVYGVTEPVSPATNNSCTLVYLYRAKLRKGAIEGTSVGGATRGWFAIVSLDSDECDAEDLTIWPGGVPVRGRLFNVDGNSCRVVGNRVQVANLHANEEADGWFCRIESGIRGVLQSNTCQVTTGGSAGALSGAATNDAFIFTDNTGANAWLITDNTIAPPTDIVGITLQGDRCVVNNNIVRHDHNGTVNGIVLLASTSETLVVGNSVINTYSGQVSSIFDAGGTGNVIPAGSNIQA